MADKLKLREFQPLDHDIEVVIKLLQKALLIALRENAYLDDYTLRYALELLDQ